MLTRQLTKYEIENEKMLEDFRKGSKVLIKAIDAIIKSERPLYYYTGHQVKEILIILKARIYWSIHESIHNLFRGWNKEE